MTTLIDKILALYNKEMEEVRELLQTAKEVREVMLKDQKDILEITNFNQAIVQMEEVLADSERKLQMYQERKIKIEELVHSSPPDSKLEKEMNDFITNNSD